MMNLDTINRLTREELEERHNAILQELNIDSSKLPFTVFRALRDVPNNIASNGMFYILLHYITPQNRGSWKFGECSQWLDHDIIKGWIILLHFNVVYTFFLTAEQTSIMCSIEAVLTQDGTLLQEFQEFVANNIDGALENTALTEEEKTHPLAAPYIIPENSGSLNIAEETSRFSGASWFDEIQKKTIILAGLGGIGRFGNLVNF